MATYDLGKVVGDAGEKGDDGSTVWNTSTAPTYANSKYTFTISNLSGKTGLDVAVNDIIFYSTYYYIVSAVNSTTVDCDTRVSIKGSDASVNIVTSWNSTTSDSKVPSEKLSKTSLDGKLDKAQTSYKGKNVVVDSSTGNITFENKPTIPSKISDLTNDSDFIETSSTSGLIKNDGTIDTTSYSTFSGSYNDLSNKPTIPSKTSDLTNDGADGTNVFVANNDSRLSDSRTPTSHTHGNLTNDGKVGSTANYFVYTTTSGAITSKQKIGNITTGGAIGSTSGLPIKTGTSGVLEAGSFGTTAGTFAEGNHTHSAYVNPTKVTSWSSTPSNDNVASEKLIKDSLDAKQATLVSGTNLKTINNNSLLGSGNIDIQGGGSGGSCVTDFYIDSNTDEWVIETSACSQGEVVTSWSSTLTDTKVPSEKLVKEYVDDLVGDAILFINGSGT